MASFTAEIAKRGNGTHICGTRAWGCQHRGKVSAVYRTVIANTVGDLFTTLGEMQVLFIYTIRHASDTHPTAIRHVII